MTTVTETLPNGNKVDYKIINGTAYRAETPDRVVSILENARQSHKRIRVFLGDTETGRDWMEEYDTMGYVGRSTGDTKIPLLVHSSRSYGGGALLDHRIVKITIDGQVQYSHPSYHCPELEVRDINLHAQGQHYLAGAYRKEDGQNVANFTSKEKAQRWVDFITGEKNRK